MNRNDFEKLASEYAGIVANLYQREGQLDGRFGWGSMYNPLRHMLDGEETQRYRELQATLGYRLDKIRTLKKGRRSYRPYGIRIELEYDSTYQVDGRQMRPAIGDYYLLDWIKADKVHGISKKEIPTPADVKRLVFDALKRGWNKRRVYHRLKILKTQTERYAAQSADAGEWGPYMQEQAKSLGFTYFDRTATDAGIEWMGRNLQLDPIPYAPEFDPDCVPILQKIFG